MLDSPQPAALASSRRRSRFGRLGEHPARNGSSHHVAGLDDVTGLRDQRVLWKELAQRTAACSPSSPLAVVVLDLDRFDEVNDRYDRSVGEAVLRASAEAAREAVPSPHLAFRYRDDELVLLVPGDEEDGREVAERARERIAAQNSSLPAVTASGGVAVLHGPVEPIVALGRVGPALQAAKRAGGNRIFLATESDRNGRNGHKGDDGGEATACRAALAMAVASLEARDRATAAHSDDVVTLSRSIGTRLGLSEEQLDRLAAAAQLHDVGKLAMPTEILSKPGALSDEEWEIIREHTVIGERMLRAVPEMGAVAGIVRHSHECWDGTGYPDGLAGEEIPLAARIILCADAFHAIRSDRPYRPGRSADDALREVKSCAGTQLDPRVVEALVLIARDVRRASGMTATFPRPRQLAALLSALAICGGSTAYAASKDVREVVRDVVKVIVPGTMLEHAEADTPDFSLRPIDQVPGITPVAALTPELEFSELRGASDYRGAIDRPASADLLTAPVLDERSGEAVDLGGRSRDPVPPEPSIPDEPVPGVSDPVTLVVEPDPAALAELVPVENVPAGDRDGPPAFAEGPSHKPAKTADASDDEDKPPPGHATEDKPGLALGIENRTAGQPQGKNGHGHVPAANPVAPAPNIAVPLENVTTPPEVVAPVETLVPLENGPEALPSLPATRPPEDEPAPVITETPSTE